MKPSGALTAACLCLAALVAAAMAPSRAGAQTLNFAPAVQSPVVSADGRVTLRLKAPNAQSVMVRRGGAPQAMTKGPDGVWSITTEPLAPNIYHYNFILDGLVIPDPSNPDIKLIYRNGGGDSMVLVPGRNGPMPWERQNVPRGAVARHSYQSALIGDDRDYYVYTPPGYDPARPQPYPVLYLLHGIIDDARAWTMAGKADVILDNLVAQGRAQPMIMVNPLGYGVPDMMLRPGLGGREMQRENHVKFEQALLSEIIPAIERQYHVGRDREHRAIAGLSMGGAQALLIGLNHMDTFSYVGGFSSAMVMLGPNPQDRFPRIADANARLRLLWLACGREDFLYEPNRRFMNWLETSSVRYSRVETPGAHTWMIWRQNLVDFTPLLFQRR
jgi:enterochelin esterase family protein